MERALNPELLATALGGDHKLLPTAEELASLLGQAEIRLLLNTEGQTSDLSDTAWYLHGVASSAAAAEAYGFGRQRAAFRVAGHIFDLLLQDESLSIHDKLAYCFGSQIGYLRSDLNPNANAIYRREVAGRLTPPQLESDPVLCSLSFGVALLGMDVGYIFNSSIRIRNDVADLTRRWQVDSIALTPYGAAALVALATRDIVSFLIYGNENSLRRSRETLHSALQAVGSDNDRTSRWVAAHLLQLGDDIERSSIWKALPPEVPPAVRRAFSLSTPRVLTLWPPQVETFRLDHEDGSHPLAADAKRMFLSTPTSGGKTLTAQLIIAAHVATQHTGVCYVAPTRSLCHEVKRALDRRLKNIGARVIADMPEWGGILDLEDPRGLVEVMTPERLSYLLRSGPADVLARFGLFVFDEVHNVADGSRGWTLEAVVSYLHAETMDTDHRIVLMSAAVGNRTHFATWMNRDGFPTLLRHSDWRGPRRLHCIWTTAADWNAERWETSRSRDYPKRQFIGLKGELHARISHNGRTQTLSTNEYVGELALRYDKNGNREKDTAKSTRFTQMLLPLIHFLGNLGPVLVIESTRPATVRLASVIAADRDAVHTAELQYLLDMIEARLGKVHPLYECVRKGVAYHHGSLPAEIRFSIEEAVSEGMLDCLVATTTMTEGINLPVRSVVIASQGFYSAGGYSEYITGSKLINAIGRAGRAAKETEGIVVLARAAEFTAKDFDRLDPTDASTKVESWLATKEALDALAAFEELERRGVDGVFESSYGPAAEFVSFIWFLAVTSERDGGIPSLDNIRRTLTRTLAWLQLSDEQQGRWWSAASVTLRTYVNTDPHARRRWGRSGASISSARVLEDIAADFAIGAAAAAVPQQATNVLQLLFDDGRLDRVLTIPEAPTRVAYNRRAGQRITLDLKLDALLLDWIRGEELSTLALQHFGGVEDIEYRFEQLGDFINDYFQVFFPWVTSILIMRANEILDSIGAGTHLPTSLPAYIRWGISDLTALYLMSHGIRSRRLASVISEQCPSDNPPDVKSWVQSLSLSEWSESFGATVPELRNLLEFASETRRSIGADLLSGEPVDVTFPTVAGIFPRLVRKWFRMMRVTYPL